jgi:hypothetical protein
MGERAWCGSVCSHLVRVARHWLHLARCVPGVVGVFGGLVAEMRGAVIRSGDPRAWVRPLPAQEVTCVVNH